MLALCVLLSSSCGYSLGAIRSGDSRDCISLSGISKGGSNGRTEIAVRAAFAKAIPSEGTCKNGNVIPVRVQSFSAQQKTLAYDENLIPALLSYTLVTRWILGKAGIVNHQTVLHDTGPYSTDAIAAEQVAHATWERLVARSTEEIQKFLLINKERYASPVT